MSTADALRAIFALRIAAGRVRALARAGDLAGAVGEERAMRARAGDLCMELSDPELVRRAASEGLATAGIDLPRDKVPVEMAPQAYFDESGASLLPQRKE